MSDFEFFFSFYGLILGLSVAEIVGGVARTIHERKTLRIGLLTPLLALFVGLDIVSFWSTAWVDLRAVPVSYPLLVVGLLVASLYYIAASLVFPRATHDWPTLDDHFWAHKRSVLLAVLGCNLVSYAASVIRIIVDGQTGSLIIYMVAVTIYIATILTAAFTTHRRVAIAAIALMIALYALQAGFETVSLILTGSPR